MAYTTIDKPTDYFNTVLYTGTGSNNSITGVGFQPDWVWQKRRDSSANHELTDSVRGINSTLVTNSSNAQDTGTDKLQSFDSDGFTAGSSSTANASGGTYASWNWLAGGTASSNTDGSITSSVSANTDAGFSICKYTGVSGAQTFGHSLGAVPKMVIVKNLDSTENWRVYHHSITASKYLKLNTTDAETSDTGPFSGTTPTSTLVYVGGDAGTCENGSEHIAYCFAEKKGYSKMGSYVGNGSTDGSYIHLGFKPAWVMYKASSITGQSWLIHDNKRGNQGANANPQDLRLLANASNTEADVNIDFLSNGFKTRAGDAHINSSGTTYIYMAFAENPFVTSTGIPTTAR